jgi:hypothetical protein
MSEIKLTDRVSIDNLVNWDLGFVSSEANRDITIPAGVKGFKQLSVAEVDGQVKLGNGFFCGRDGFGNNAYIKINDEDVKAFIFGTGNDETKEEVLLTLDNVKKLLSVTPKVAFEKELAKLVVTEAEKKMIVSLATEAGIEDAEGYKKTAIEKISGYTFN